MIAVDTSVWADHFRAPEPGLTDLIRTGSVLVHPFVIGELAMGRLPHAAKTLAALRALPRLMAVEEALFPDRVRALDLFATGLGFVDAHLLLAVEARAGARLWTRDKKLRDQATRLKLVSEQA